MNIDPLTIHEHKDSELTRSVKMITKEEEEETNYKNPLNISLIVEKIIRKLPNEDLWEVRLVNSFWRNEANHVIRHQNSLKKIINFRSREDVLKFTTIFNPFLLHDSFNLNFHHEPEHNEKFYLEFVELVGPYTKHLDLTNHPYSKKFELEDPRVFFSFFKPMYADLLERILFQEFPNLVVLIINVYNSGPNDKHLMFRSEEERKNLYSRHRLPSLTTLNLNVEWDWIEGKERLILAEEIMKLAPNLFEINVRVNWRTYPEMSKLFQGILSSISCFAPKVRVMTFDTNMELAGKWEEEGEFQNLYLKSLTLNENSLIFPSDFVNRFNFFSKKTPLASTVEELRLISKFGLKVFEPRISKFPAKSHYIPFGFKNIRVLEIVHPFNELNRLDFFNELYSETPLIEDFTISMIPSFPKFESLVPWVSLKKLNLSNNHQLHWNDLESFLDFYKIIRKMAPNLLQLGISLGSKERQSAVRNTKSHVIAYPFFVWVGNVWENLKTFKVSLDEDSLVWSKGTEERFLGIGSIKELNDKNGDFTTREITKLNFCLILYRNEFLFQDSNEFFHFLQSTFPKHYILNQARMGDINEESDGYFLRELFYSSLLKEKLRA